MQEELESACENGDLTEVKRLVKNGVNVNGNNNIAIFQAGIYNQPEIIKFLIENGADFQHDNEVVLRAMILHKQFDMVKFLVEEKKCDVCTNNNWPLRVAMNISLPIAKYLIKHGANIGTILPRISLVRQIDYAKYLVINGANVNFCRPELRSSLNKMINAFNLLKQKYRKKLIKREVNKVLLENTVMYPDVNSVVCKYV